MRSTLRSRDVAELILDAYRRTGATPAAGTVFQRLGDGSIGRCVLGVLGVVAGVADPAEWLPSTMRLANVSSANQKQIGKRLELPTMLLAVLPGAFDHAFLRGVPTASAMRRQLRLYRKSPDAQLAVLTAWRVVRALRAPQRELVATGG